MIFGRFSLRTRFALLCGSLVAVFLVALGWVFQAEARRLDRVHADLGIAASLQARRWFELAARPLHDAVADVAAWSQTRAFLRSRDAQWARAHLDPAAIDASVDAIWILREDGTELFALSRDPALGVPELPANPSTAAPAHQARTAVFARSAGGLWQLSAAPVRGGEGVTGWVVGAQRWDERRIAHLAAASELQVKLMPPSTVPPATEPFLWRQSLLDANGAALGELAISAPQPLLSEDREHGLVITLLFVSFGVALVLALVLAVARWVLRPLGLIGESLRLRSPGPLQEMPAHSDEFRELAELVRQSFAHRELLAREVDERRRAESALRASQENLRHSLELRARLARDLHDHVIQSIYAAGLGLEAVRAQLSVDPFGAEGRIRHCMDNLNETIRHVRSYISDLEPDPTGARQPFADAVRALTSTMQALWPVEFVLELDDAAGEDFTNLVEVHALQIVREALSNAMRHGRATRVEISLQRQAGAPVLSIRDNGCGFDPVARMGTGRGLVNLTTRAREIGATLRIDSSPGAGTAVILRFAAPPP